MSLIVGSTFQDVDGDGGGNDAVGGGGRAVDDGVGGIGAWRDVDGAGGHGAGCGDGGGAAVDGADVGDDSGRVGGRTCDDDGGWSCSGLWHGLSAMLGV